MLHVVGTRVLKVSKGDQKGKFIEYFGDFSFDTFSVHTENKTFQLDKTFVIELKGSRQELYVHLDETSLWKEIYTNDKLFTALSKEACVVLDIARNMGGSEAVAESYYSVMKTQRKDGGQDNESIDMRTLIDWSLPPVYQCPQTISNIATIYRKGNGKAKVSGHRAPVFFDKRHRSAGKYSVSKVVDRLVSTKTKFPYFK